AATCCRVVTAVASHGSGSISATSSPIQASNRSPARISASASSAARSRKAWKAAVVAGRSGPRWISEAIQTRPERTSLFNDRSFLDDYVFGRYVLMEAAATGLDVLDLVYDFSAFNDLGKHGVAPAIGSGSGVVQEVVVGHVDEELCGCRMRIGRACHGHGVTIVLQAVVGFVLDGVAGLLLLHPAFETTALDHEVVDDAMKDGAVIEA